MNIRVWRIAPHVEFVDRSAARQCVKKYIGTVQRAQKCLFFIASAENIKRAHRNVPSTSSASGFCRQLIKAGNNLDSFLREILRQFRSHFLFSTGLR